MLDRFVSENASNAKRTLEKIEQALDYYNSRMSNAWQNYQQALAALQYAQSYDDYVPYFYYTAVSSTKAEYNRLKECCNRIKDIKTTFREQSDTLQRTIAEDAETYSIICKKGGAFIEKYIEVLNRSNSAVK
jgi:predicted transcriptional regulator